jgi:hypothetical protein
MGFETRERREASAVQLTMDPAPRRLREILERVNEGLGDVEPSTLGHVRLILTEILGRSVKDRGELRVEIVVLSESVRIELAGRGLALPDHPSFYDDDEDVATFPLSVLNEHADHWGVDRRQAEPGIWLLLPRG